MVGLKSRAIVIWLVATVWKIAGVQAGVNVMNVISNVTATVCKYGCGYLYKDWYGELVCPICGYNVYEEDNVKRNRGDEPFRLYRLRN